ncbi:MAG: hypothetical protein COT91_00485 [Candidatus Doudnabacteria bacterium CG10_big_fil_rev_8_21_14_0_10_41_10]|uniref:Uncharacterized protein n=1 Tax=Candidatus Doudnabacteria bacterium CG10_big_fil_rev_8_21_14_0_10_41_10 TaxID=1974551 RepID=A0A2H0VEU2_9BACT|nr:MAG: hypothetical protein COT91_00485 [Candidatus Doudnabacteria bacterium CG10_big_fil_rev_8_21_14_0_10_41_10]
MRKALVKDEIMGVSCNAGTTVKNNKVLKHLQIRNLRITNLQFHVVARILGENPGKMSLIFFERGASRVEKIRTI